MIPIDKFNELGDKYESIEEQKFGKKGFEKILEQVSQIEKALGIYDLNQYTYVSNIFILHLSKTVAIKELIWYPIVSFMPNLTL